MRERLTMVWTRARVKEQVIASQVLGRDSCRLETAGQLDSWTAGQLQAGHRLDTSNLVVYTFSGPGD